MLKSLGWRNPTTDKNADAKAKSHLVGLAGEKGSGTYSQQKQDRENSPVNRHRIKQKAEEEIHPRHRAIEEVLRIPPDIEGMTALKCCTIYVIMELFIYSKF